MNINYMLASNVVDCGFEPRSNETKDYECGICSFSAKHATLRGNNKDWLTRNQIMCQREASYLHADCCFGTIKSN